MVSALPAPLPDEDWFVPLRRQQQARVRLLLFHYAGGGPQVFRPWLRWVPEDVEVVAFQLPGRRPGHGHRLLTSIDEVVARASSDFLAQMDRPAVVYGHSIGALIAFEMLRASHRRGGPQARHLAVSARRAPHCAPPLRPLHLLPDAEFVECLEAYGGTPREILDDECLLSAFLPRLRADFALSETYRFVDGPLLSCPVSALAGTDDVEACVSDVSEWRWQTSSSFRLQRVRGGHFFIHAREPVIADALIQLLATT